MNPEYLKQRLYIPLAWKIVAFGKVSEIDLEGVHIKII